MQFDKLKALKIKYWNDPVWSKVISAIIIGIGSAILGLIWVIITSLYKKIPFREVLMQLVDYMGDNSSINNGILLFFILFLIFALSTFLLDRFRSLRAKKDIEREDVLPSITEHSTSFFANRLADAFPGQRGLVWYTDPKVIVSRMAIVLRDPLQFDRDNVPRDYAPDPIWWFRGLGAMFYSKFTKLSSTKILLDLDELNIERIAVNIDERYYQSFIYVEAKGDKPSGVKKLGEDYYQSYTDHFGYVNEEVGFYNKKYYTREEYQDRATIIKGKVKPIPNMTLRVRYLSRYNFLIAAKQSPFNSSKFQNETQELFDNILAGKNSFDDFYATVVNYKRKQSFSE